MDSVNPTALAAAVLIGTIIGTVAALVADALGYLSQVTIPGLVVACLACLAAIYSV